MAPRPPESKAEFLRRLARVPDQGEQQLRFGQSHHTHAACRDTSGHWTIRRLELERAAAEAYLAEHGSFMPEHAEMLSTPGAVVLEAATRAALIQALERRPWPLGE